MSKPGENERESVANTSDSASENPSSKTAPKGAGRFLRFSLIYGLGDLLTKGARIVLIPFYLSVMEKSEIGELAILQAIIFCTWTLLGFGLGFAIHKYYYEYKENGDAMVSTLWLARLVGGLPFYALMMLAGWGFYSLGDDSIALGLILLAITAGFLKGGLNVVEFWLNIREEAVKYRAFTFAQFLLTTLIIVFLVAWLKMGVLGVILGELISYSVFVFVSAFLLFRRAMPDLSVVRWREIVGYCSPVLPHAFFMWGLTGIDRLMLNGLGVEKSKIGVYAIGYLLGSFLSIVVRSMRSAWLPAYFKNAESSDSNQEFGKIASLYLFLAFFTALCGMFFAPEIIYLFSLTSATSYSESEKVMQFVLFGFVAMALFLAINQPLFYARRTGTLSLISGFGLAVNVAVNYLLIPSFGIWGACAASVTACVAMALVTFVVTSRICKIKWETSAMLLTTFSFLVFGGVAWLFPAESNFWLIPPKILIVMLFPLITLFRIRISPESAIKIESRFAWTTKSKAKVMARTTA